MTRVVLYRKEVFHDISSMTSTGHHQDNKTQAKAKELIDHGLAAYT
jgi:acetyl-CoA carboxylase beta subunit